MASTPPARPRPAEGAPGTGHEAGARARPGAGEPEAGNLLPFGQAWQPVLLLRLGAEVEQELARSERVRHHGGDRRGERTGGELADDLGMGTGGEAQAAVGLRDDHRE